MPASSKHNGMHCGLPSQPVHGKPKQVLPQMMPQSHYEMYGFSYTSLLSRFVIV